MCVPPRALCLEMPGIAGSMFHALARNLDQVLPLVSCLLSVDLLPIGQPAQKPTRNADGDGDDN
ncbi:hypothetical protein CFAM422_004035 [Trichoderma lentiforme]|uniref:Uncharacterized protein n=1 Tax=Trichoderma lentiforme TaxID=1567552 RepID=A0A9P4XGH7_9HYPO|nr:hypothetical protein CFAM422_004035 [Trichoderma lentiforme]